MLLGLIRLLHTFQQVPRNMMEDRGRSSFQAPSLSAKSRPAGTFLLRRLHSEPLLLSFRVGAVREPPLRLARHARLDRASRGWGRAERAGLKPAPTNGGRVIGGFPRASFHRLRMHGVVSPSE